MKKLFLLMLTMSLLFINGQAISYEGYTPEYYAKIESFINSPDKADLEKITDKIVKHCEEVYLEATRRREYTDLEMKYCEEIFESKRQDELAYKNYYTLH